MESAIYFSRVQFDEYIGLAYRSRLMLNLVTKELSYQVFDSEKEQNAVFSYGIKLDDGQVASILPYCDANEFEPYRFRKMSVNDGGYIGYRDEVKLRFSGITESHIPLIELPMDYYYSEKYMWPGERLYKYLIKSFFEGNKKTKKWVTPYGGLSLF